MLPRHPVRPSILPAASVLLACLVACGGEPDAAPAEAEARPELDAADVAAGHDLYMRYCALCHGEEGQGYLADNAPALANQSFLRVVPDELLRRAISEGHPGTPMAAFSATLGGPMSPEEIGQVVTYLRSLGPAPIDVSRTRVLGDARRGGTVYQSSCASCHGERGEGVDAPTLAHPVFQSSASAGFLRETISRGREGTPMPAFQATLSSQEIDDVVAFVRALPPIGSPAPAPDGPPPPDMDHLVINPDGPPPEFTVREDRFVPGAEVRAALDAGARMILLDARPASAWAEGHIPGSAPFPFYSVDELAGHLPNDGTWIIAYCACPHAASGHVVDDLRARDFEHAVILDEGITWWTNEGHPVERGAIP